MFCPHCGAPVPDGRLQCPQCGKPLGPPPLPAAQALPAKKSSSKAIWLIIGCAVVPVLLAIVGIIAAIFIPNFLDALHMAKQKRAVSELQLIGQAVDAYKVEHGFAPAANTLDALATELGGSAASLPRVDPWQHPYRYGCWQEESASGCDHYRLVSAGRDGRFEQQDLAAYEPGGFERHAFDRDLVFGDGEWIVLPGVR